MTAFDTAWLVVKAILPDLPFDAELRRITGYNPYVGRDAVTYEASVAPDVARGLLDDKPYLESINDMDKRKFGGALRAWDRELTNSPDLFRFPHHILERITGRHTNEMQMPYSVFNEYASQPKWRDEFSELETDPMNTYVDTMEDMGLPVIVGAGDYNTKRKELSRILTNPGFGGRGIGQHLLGSMLQDHGYLRDTQFSHEGANAFNKLGRKLTVGGTPTALPILGEELPPSDFISRYYQGQGIVDTVLGDVRYTQPYGDTPRPEEGYWSRDDDGLDRWNHAPSYPIEHSQIRGGKGYNPAVKGRYPMSIRYTGVDPHFVTNLGRKVA